MICDRPGCESDDFMDFIEVTGADEYVARRICTKNHLQRVPDVPWWCNDCREHHTERCPWVVLTENGVGSE